jgi:hypothetical protein
VSRRSTGARERLRDAGAALIPLTVLSAAVLVLNAARWGSPLDFGYRHSFEDRTLRASLFTDGVKGILYSFFAPSRGLFFLAFPVVFLGGAGLARLFRQDRPIALCLLLGVAATVVPPSLSPVLWHGAWSWGPRYHLGCLVYLTPAAAVALDAALRVKGTLRAAALSTIAAGFLAAFPALVSSPFGFLFAAAEALRIERPASSFADPAYRDNEALAEANRQETLLFAPPSSPYNAIRGQWAWFSFGLRGSETIPVREMFGIDSAAHLTPHLLEYGCNRSAWPVAMRARTGSVAGLAVAGLLAVVAGTCAVALVTALRRDDPVALANPPSSQLHDHDLRRVRRVR